MRRSAQLIIAAAIASLGIAPSAVAAPTTPTTVAHKHRVTAAIIGREFCSGSNGWQTLDAQWPAYGSVPLHILPDTGLCSGSFTLADLEATHADTLIFSATAAGVVLTQDQINAVQTYAEEGHNLLGTGLTFGTGDDSNNALAPLFGLAEQSIWHENFDSSFSYSTVKHQHFAPLFRQVSAPFVSSHDARGQRPADSNWGSDDLAGAAIVATTEDTKAVVTLYHGDGYTAVYIANIPEYHSTPDDLQFLYNAIIYPR